MFATILWRPNMKKLNLILALFAISLSANVWAESKQPSLAHQMWQFAYPDYQPPKHIPRQAKEVIFTNDKKIIFPTEDNKAKAGNIEYTEVVADYPNGYLSVIYDDGSMTEVVAFKDRLGSYALFKEEARSSNPDCIGYSEGQEIYSNYPVEDNFPDIKLQTFIPTFSPADYSLYTPIYYLDMDFPRRGTTVTATLIPLNYPSFVAWQKDIGRQDSDGDITSPLAYGNVEFIESLSNGQYILNAWITRLVDKQSLYYALAGDFDAMNRQDSKALAQLLAENPNDLFYEKKHLSELLQDYQKIYAIDKQIKYRQLKLVWNKDSASFRIVKKIPNHAPVAKSFYDYLMRRTRYYDACYTDKDI